jgi:hypothetical protein
LINKIGKRLDDKGRKGEENVLSKKSVKIIWEKWRSVWMLEWERKRSLKEKY